MAVDEPCLFADLIPVNLLEWTGFGVELGRVKLHGSGCMGVKLRAAWMQRSACVEYLSPGLVVNQSDQKIGCIALVN